MICRHYIIEVRCLHRKDTAIHTQIIRNALYPIWLYFIYQFFSRIFSAPSCSDDRGRITVTVQRVTSRQVFLCKINACIACVYFAQNPKGRKRQIVRLKRTCSFCNCVCNSKRVTGHGVNSNEQHSYTFQNIIIRLE